jgi:amidohydrolase
MEPESLEGDLTELTDGIRPDVLEMSSWLVELRRDLHRHPELKFQEKRTSGTVAGLLQQWGLAVTTGLASTGVVGLWDTGRPGRVLGIRADMDALPIQEVQDRAHASENPGVMHACGHDAHVTMALGAARILATTRPGLCGAVKFIFQPGEEGGAGGLKMLQEGALENPRVDRALALHVFPTLRVGEVGLTPGPALASVDDFVIRLHGQGSHAAHPHTARDPILAGAAMVQALQAIVSRGTDPLESLVVSVTCFQAGTAFNIIPEQAEIWGTIRALKESVRQRAHASLEEIVQGVARAHGVRAELEIQKGYPVLSNDPEVTAFVEEVAGRFLGRDRVIHLPASMGSEDFSYFLERCPGAFVVIGCSDPDGGPAPMLHTPRFDICEEVLPLGVELLLRCAEAFLGPDA